MERYRQAKLFNYKKSNTDNYFVKKLKERRSELELQRMQKQSSWLDRQPYMKLEYNAPYSPNLVLEEESYEGLNSSIQNASSLNKNKIGLVTV